MTDIIEVFGQNMGTNTSEAEVVLTRPNGYVPLQHEPLRNMWVLFSPLVSPCACLVFLPVEALAALAIKSK